MGRSCVGNARWVVVILIALLLPAAWIDRVGATTCPAVGDAPTALTNGASYQYANCVASVNVTGADVSNVTMLFINSSVGSIALSGSAVANFSLAAVGSSVMTGTVSISVASLVSNVSVLLASSSAVGGVALVNVMTPLARLDGLSVAAVDSAIDGPGLLLTAAVDSMSRVSVHVTRSAVRASSGTSVISVSPKTTCSSLDVAVVGSNVTTTMGHFFMTPDATLSPRAANISLLISGSSITLGSGPGYTAYLASWSGVNSLAKVSIIVCCRSTISCDTVISIGFLGSTRTSDAMNIALSDSVMNISNSLVHFYQGLGTLRNFDVSITNSNIMSGAPIVACDRADGSKKIQQNVSFLVWNSVAKVTAGPCFQSGGMDRIEGFAVFISGSSLLCPKGALIVTLQTADAAAVPAQTIENVSVVIVNSTRVEATSNHVLNINFNDLSATQRTISNIHVAVTSSVLLLGLSLIFDHVLSLQGPANVRGVSVSLVNSSCQGGVAVVMGTSYLNEPSLANVAQSIHDVTVRIVSSNISFATPMLCLGNATSMGNIIATFSNTTLRSTAQSVIAFVNVAVIDSFALVNLRNTSRVAVSMTFGLTSLFFITRNVSAFRGTVEVTVSDSTVDMDLSTAFVTLGVMQLSGVTIEASGSFHGTIRNSTVSLRQRQSTFVDACGVFSFTYVTTASPGSVVFVVDQKSTVIVSCFQIVGVVNSQQSPSLSFFFSAAGGSRLTLETSATSGRSSVSKMYTGSFVVTLLNSLISNSNISISDCTISCGIICQLVGNGWNDGFLYTYGLYTIFGYFPPTVLPRLTNSSISLRNCSVGPISAAAILLPLRAMFSFVNATNTTVAVEGPVEVWGGGYDGIFLGGDGRGSGQMNRLVLLNCDAIAVRRDVQAGGGLVPLGEALAPHGWGGVDVQSRRAGGQGSCGLTRSASVTVDGASASSSPTATATSTASIALPVAAVKPVQSATHLALGRAAAAVAAVSGPALAMAVQVLHAQQLVSGCPGAGNDGPPDLATSPTQLSVGQDQARYDRGTVVGNVALLAACGALALLAAALGRSTGKQTPLATKLGLPGILYVPYSFLLVPTATSATALLVGADATAADCAVGLAALAAVLVPLGVLAAVTTTRLFRARAVRVSLRGGRRGRGAAVRMLKTWYDSMAAYSDAPGAAGFVERWDYAGVADYMPRRQWFVALEEALGLATGVIAGLTTLGARSCTALNAAQSVAAVGFLAALLALRPHSVRADRWSAVSSSLLQSAVALLGLAGRDASMPLLTLQLALSVLYLGGYVAWGVGCNGTRFLRLLLRRRPGPFHGVGLSPNGASCGLTLDEDELKGLLDALASSSKGTEANGGGGGDGPLAVLVRVICKRSS